MRIEFESPAEKEKIIAEQTTDGLVLIGEENIVNGDFLIFSTTEEVAIKEAELMKKNAKKELSDRDRSGEDIRLIEDIVDILIAKGLMTESDLPQSAKDKLSKRRELRTKL